MKVPRRKVLGALTAAAGSTLLPSTALLSESFASPAPTRTPTQVPASTANTVTNPLPKEKVTGIGGFFFRSQDHKALAQWYQDHLGINITPRSTTDPVWQQQAGPTSFTPFPAKTTYIDDAAKQWMINFRVSDLDKMAAQLQAAGIVVTVDPTAYPYGRFAKLHDPEGNAIELWQPMSPVTTK